MKFKKFIFKKVNSTNLTAINILKKTKLNYGMIVADLQSKGKGQYGRKWISIKGNLFVSFFYNLDKIDLSLKKLTKLNCNLVKKTISKFYKKKILFKEPNDLLINGKKICGILQETIYKKEKFPTHATIERHDENDKGPDRPTFGGRAPSIAKRVAESSASVKSESTQARQSKT